MKNIYDELEFVERVQETFTDDQGKTWYRYTDRKISLSEVDALFPPGCTDTLVSQLADELRSLWKYCSFLKCSLRSGEHSAAEFSYKDFKKKEENNND
jgi:hypothetical protein